MFLHILHKDLISNYSKTEQENYAVTSAVIPHQLRPDLALEGK